MRRCVTRTNCAFVRGHGVLNALPKRAVEKIELSGVAKQLFDETFDCTSNVQSLIGITTASSREPQEAIQAGWRRMIMYHTSGCMKECMRRNLLHAIRTRSRVIESFRV